MNRMFLCMAVVCVVVVSLGAAPAEKPTSPPAEGSQVNAPRAEASPSDAPPAPTPPSDAPPIAPSPANAAAACGGQDCFGGPDCDYSSWYTAPWCGWYFRAEGMFLHRGHSRDIKIAEDGVGQGVPRGQRPALLTTDEIGIGEAWGPRLTLGKQVDCSHAIEFVYYGLFDWQGAAEVNGANIDVPFDSHYSSDYDDTQRVRGSYGSRLYNVEANWICGNCCSLVRPLIGFRYLGLLEDFDLEVTEDPLDGADTSNYLIYAENHLVGVQVGALIERSLTERLCWGFDVKAGLYDNFARQRTFMRGNNNTVVRRDFSTAEGELAFIGELGLDLSYQWTDCMALTCGYQLMWLSGVALAPEQFDFTTAPDSGSRLNDDGTLFLHGVYLGLQISR